MKRWVLAAMLAAGVSPWAGAALAEGEASGVWRLENGKVTVRVSPCGGNLCGKVIALKKPRDDKGNPRLDKENPNASLRSRPVIGLTILSNMKPAGDNRWKGTIYNPDDGNTYSSNMKLQGGDVMKVQGCIAGVFCKTMKFLKVQ